MLSDCGHIWEMTNIEFGHIIFERCSHCKTVRTHFSLDNVCGDEYREGDCIFSDVKTAQSFRFDLQCTKCDILINYRSFSGLLHCTGCLADCPVEILQKECEAKKTWILVAFGFLPVDEKKPFPPHLLEILTDYFNQQRDTSRSRIKIVSYEMIEKFSVCKGEFLYDRGMLSLEPETDRESLL
jgi:hypothetical protein